MEDLRFEMTDDLVPVVGGHVVVGHVAQLVHLGYGQRLTRRTTRVWKRRPVDVPVAAVRRVALRCLIQSGVVLGSHGVIPTRILYTVTIHTHTVSS